MRLRVGSVMALLVRTCTYAAGCTSSPGMDGSIASDKPDGMEIQEVGVDSGRGDDGGADSGSAPMCLSACGTGSLTGTWSYEGICGEGVLATIVRDCGNGSTFEVTRNMASGELRIHSDGEFVHVQQRGLAGSLNVATQCLEALGGCAVFGDRLQPGGNCSDMGAMCSCSFDSTASRTSTGTHDMVGNQLRLRLTSGSEEVYDYCAMGADAMLQLAVPQSPESYRLRRR